jgi:oligoendopeptidase F
MEPSTKTDIGTPAKWDLSFLYQGPDDPQLEEDLRAYETLAASFCKLRRGNLKTALGPALRDLITLVALENKVMLYISEAMAVDASNTVIAAKLAEVEQRQAAVRSKFLTFFDLEVAALDEMDLEGQIANDGTVRHHQPFLAAIRRKRPHQLSADKEQMLALCKPLMLNPWSLFYEKTLAEMRLPWETGTLSFEEMVHLTSADPDAERRAAALKLVNDAMGGAFGMISANTLNEAIAAMAMEDEARGRPHPMHFRNRDNRLSDRTVEALHEVVASTGAQLCQRYYRLKAALLGQAKLRWSDRNAPMPFKDNRQIPWAQAVTTVRQAYRAFSPTLGGLVDRMFEEKLVDAAPGGSRQGGAHCNYTVLPNGQPAAVVFQTYLGTTGCVSTLAHELGHGCHGFLAGEAQGILQFDAPMGLAETASIFGESLVFEPMLEEALRTDEEAALALLMERLDAGMNTVVRQVGFSLFERDCHGHVGETLSRRPIKQWSVAEFDAKWLASLECLYGEAGDIFTYDDVEHLWAYVHHFHTPFYVHSYSVADMFVQSLIAQRERLGADFEPLLLAILRAGNTKDAVAILAPAGLNPEGKEFWENGLEVSIGRFLRLAEELAAKRGLVT